MGLLLLTYFSLGHTYLYCLLVLLVSLVVQLSFHCDTHTHTLSLSHTQTHTPTCCQNHPRLSPSTPICLHFVSAKFQYLTFSTHILSVLSSTSVLHNSSVKIRWLLVPRRPRCTVPRQRPRGLSLLLPVPYSWNSRNQQCGSQATWVFGENCWRASHHFRFIIVLPMQSPFQKKKMQHIHTNHLKRGSDFISLLRFLCFCFRLKESILIV